MEILANVGGKTYGTNFWAKFNRFDEPQQCNVISKVGHGKAFMHDNFIDAIRNSISTDMVRPYREIKTMYSLLDTYTLNSDNLVSS